MAFEANNTSRRNVLAAALIAPFAIVAPAVAAHPAGDAHWLALLAEERRANAAFEAALETLNHVYSQYLEALNTCEDDWHNRFSARRFPVVPEIAGESPEAREIRVQAAVRAWNEEGAAFRTEKDGIKPRLREQYGIDAVDMLYATKSDQHRKSIKAIIAYPSNEPEIIAHKLQLLVNEYGDEMDMLAPLLASIGSAA